MTEERLPCAKCGQVLYRPHMMDARGWCPVCVRAEFFQFTHSNDVAEFAYHAFTHGVGGMSREDWFIALEGYEIGTNPTEDD